MVLINFTNIIVDDFTIAKQKPFCKYVHFLTHMHTDHFNGLSDSWNLGPIYCSQITGRLLSHKFPKIQNIITLRQNTQYVIPLTDNKQMQVAVTLFDANHCAGAVMFLFEGYFGRVLHTGDIRFNKQKFQDYYLLYPHHLRNSTFSKCSLQIDLMYLDNTFCDPLFKFPLRHEVLAGIQDFISTVQGKKIYIGLDNLGKQEILVHLAQKFQTLIVVDDTRYKNIINCGYNHQLFTTVSNQGWIQVVPKKLLYKKLNENQNSFGIIPTGWSNSHFIRAERLHYFPYSLHSNYQELEEFVKSIQPSEMVPIVRSVSKKQQIQDQYKKETDSLKQLYEMASYKQTGFQLLKKLYKRPYSQTYQNLLSNYQQQKYINKLLGLIPTREQINSFYNKQTVKERQLFKRQRKGAKMKVQRDQEAINQIKQQIQKYKNKQKSEIQVINIDSDDNLENYQTNLKKKAIIQIPSSQENQSNKSKQKQTNKCFTKLIIPIAQRSKQPFTLPTKASLQQPRQLFLDFFFKAQINQNQKETLF